MAVISGVLTDPIGSPLTTRVRFVCLDGEGSVLKSALATITLGAGGTYNFTIANGDYSIELYSDSQWNLVGKVRVTASTTDGTIQELIDNNPIPTV